MVLINRTGAPAFAPFGQSFFGRAANSMGEFARIGAYPDLEMTIQAIATIELGPAYMRDQHRNPVGLDLYNLPASIHHPGIYEAAPMPDRWYFQVDDEASDAELGGFESPEEALAGLKVWLWNNRPTWFRS